MPSLSRITAAAILVWLGFLFYASTVLVRIHQQSNVTPETSPNADSVLERRLTKALEDVENLKQQNEQLKNWLNQKTSPNQKLSAVKDNHYPPNSPSTKFDAANLAHFSSAHENLRRTLTNGIVEFWSAVGSKLDKLKKSNDAPSSVDQILTSLSEQHRTVLADALKLAEVDNADVWRRNQLQNLTNLVQRRLEYLQNPVDCQNARKLVCHLNKGCGFGCQIHHASYCFIMAYATNRTLILNTVGWRYSQKGWDSVFLPVSKTCAGLVSDANAQAWRGYDEQKDVPIISVPIIDSLRPRPPHLPLSFPKDLAESLLLLHSNPPVWWVAQFVYYLMRYQTDLQKDMDETERRLGFKGPVVGLHVRRTDKVGSEAAFHSIEEYMKYADEWFLLQALKNGSDSYTKRVYLATDEPSLIDETKRKYVGYEVYADTTNANSAQLNNRYSDASLHGIIADIHFLARCDYLVCTFSSQVCRIAYELMQIIKGGDAADRFKSLDDIYYFGGQEGHEQIAVYAHTAADNKDELLLRVGDSIGVAGNHWDGYSKGRNGRSGQTGLYPSYKVKEKWRIVDFPVYPPTLG